MASSSSTKKDSSMAASSSSSSTKKTIVLISKEGENFEVDEAIALLSQTVKSLIEDDCIDGGIPLPNVDSETLAKVLEYCTPHASGGDEDLSKLDSEYVKDLKNNQNMLFDVIQAANYLNIEKLLNLTCQTVADMMKGKSPEQIRKIFHIKNDYSAEEEAAVREENKWAFD